MTQFKDKAGKDRENASVGLYAYPNLMSADILAYKATHVPVGEDQKQHLELARDTAQKFNNDFKVDFFPLPEPLIQGAGARVMSLRDGTRKMSKSDESDYSRINLTDDADAIALKFRKAKSDPDQLPDSVAGLEGRPEASNLLGIYAALSDRTKEEAVAEFAGKSFSEFKRDLTDLAVAVMAPISTEMKRYLADPAQIDAILSEGAKRARAISSPIMAEIQEIVGFLKAN
jgi:tryptophanyl-tRNA synthetase